MSENVPDHNLPEGLMRDLVELFARYGHAITPDAVLEAMIRLLRGDGNDRRSSSRMIYVKLVNAYKRPPTDFIRGERMARADDLSMITGEAISGIQTRAEAEAEAS
jgi:hypothetical protein